MNFLDKAYYGNSVQAYFIAGAIALVAFAVATTVRLVIVRRLGRVVEQTHTRLDDLAYELVKQTKFWIITTISLYCGTLALVFPPARVHILQTVAVAALALQGGIWLASGVTQLLGDYRRGKAAVGNTSSLGVVTMLAFAGREIMRAFEKNGIAWALPAQSIHVSKG